MLSLPSNVSLADADQTCSDDPRLCFEGFEDDDTVIPKDKAVARTFSFPPIKAGFMVDVYNKDILPHISIEVFEVSDFWSGDFSVDVGVATSRVFSSLTWELVPLVKAGPSVWVGYNIKEVSQAYGIGFTILDF